MSDSNRPLPVPLPAPLTPPREEGGPRPPEPWVALRRLTPARIALGRAGESVPLREVLSFAAAHAMARDAVHVPLDASALLAELHQDGFEVLQVASRAPHRDAYLRRPDWGRRLNEAAAASLAALREQDAQAGHPPADLTVVVADGLSAVAAQRHAAATLRALRSALPRGLRIGPLVLATQARVALGDEVGELLGSRMVLILIGERPGLSSPDSLGAYLTHAPRVGRSDAERNCVSNIRPEGLQPSSAAARLAWLIEAALRLRLTGVQLKEESDRPVLAAHPGPEALTGSPSSLP